MSVDRRISESRTGKGVEGKLFNILGKIKQSEQMILIFEAICTALYVVNTGCFTTLGHNCRR